MKIREATPEDITAIRALEEQAPTAAHWGERDYAQLLSVTGKNHVVLVAEQPEGIEGFLVGSCIGPEWEIENVVVADAVHTRGIGTQLVLEYMRRARAGTADAIFLEVRQSNAAARKLYEKCGFLKIGCRKCYYSDPLEDAVLYKASLSAR